jgi:hypothetical protein
VTKRDNGDPNERLVASLVEAAQRLQDAGMEKTEAFVTANKTLLERLGQQAPAFAESLQREGSRTVRKQRWYEGGFHRRLRRHWGGALDLLLILVGIAEEAGSYCDARNRAHVVETNDVLFDVLHRLNGQACRLTREVHALLQAGFPFGALARTRSLHEISVRAQVLKAYGRGQEHEDLAERYVLHDHVVNYKDALEFQRHAARLGYEPLSDHAMAEMKEMHDVLVARYGSVYRSAYGWAAGLPDLPSRPSFADLERFVQIDHLRGHYAWASHEVQADSKSMRLNVLERGGSSALLTGATNFGLADAGVLAAIYLHQTLVSFLLCVDVPAHFDLLTLQAMARLVDDAEKAFGQGQARVEAAEERLQTRLARRGKRMDPIAGVVRL